MGTFENRYDTALKDAIQSGDDVDYLLKTVPYIKEYFQPDEAPDARNMDAAPLAGFVKVTGTKNRNEVLNRYLAEVEGHDVDITVKESVSRQENCDCGGRYVRDHRQALSICTQCGKCSSFFDVSEASVTYTEQSSQYTKITRGSYKRSNHFSEWINGLMGRESTQIPPEVVAAVKAEFKKLRTTSTADITPKAVREFLRKLKLNKWYDHTHAICAALHGKPAPVMSPQLEETLKTMFQQIQAPFNKHVHTVDPERKNMLSYSYCLYKFCELLGEDEYLEYFSLLKCNDKLHKIDRVWKLICQELQWEFIPTL